MFRLADNNFIIIYVWMDDAVRGYTDHLQKLNTHYILVFYVLNFDYWPAI